MIYYHSSEEMPELGDESVHCVITSPPYPMIAKWDECFHRQGADSFQNMHSILGTVWNECYRVLVPGGIMCVNIGDATRTKDKEFVCWPNYAYMMVDCMHIGFTPLIPILWKKISNRPNAFLGSGFQPVNAYISQDCEYIAIMRKGRLRQFSDEEKVLRKDSSFTKEERDLWFQQVWEITGKMGAKKDSGWPVEIPYRLMRMFSIKTDIILDPFCGNGNEFLYTQWDRSFVGYEVTDAKINP